MKKFLLALLAFLPFLAGGQPVQAGDIFVKKVYVGKLRPTRTHGNVSWDPVFNSTVFVNAGLANSSGLDNVKTFQSSGRVPEKYEVPAGTVLTNWYVEYRGGDYAHLCKHFNRGDGKYQIESGEKRYLADYGGGLILSVGTCANLMPWCPPKKVEQKPKPEAPCAEFMICKKVTGGGSLDGFVFDVTYPNGEKHTFTTDTLGMVQQTGLAYGDYTFDERPRDGYKRIHPAVTPVTIRLSKEKKLAEVIFVNEKCAPPPVETPCAEFMICKKVINGGGLDGFVFEVTYPNGDKRTFTTDKLGMVHQTGLAYGEYKFVELPREGYKLVHPDKMPIVRTLTKETKSIEVIVVNEKCAPAPTPEFNGEAQAPPPVVLAPPPPGRVSGYVTGRPSKQVDREVVAGGGAGVIERQRVTNVNRRVVINRRQPPRQRVPPEKAVPGTKPPQRPIYPGSGDLPDGQ